MQIVHPKTWLILLILLLCSLAGPASALSLEPGTSCLASWSGDDCPRSCALASLAPKAISYPDCHHHPGLPLKNDGQLLTPCKRLDQTTFVLLVGRPREHERRTSPPELLLPQRPLLPNQTLAALGTVMLRN